MAQKENMYLNSIRVIGFIGKDPEPRHRQGSEAIYTVFFRRYSPFLEGCRDAWQNRTEWHPRRMERLG